MVLRRSEIDGTQKPPPVAGTAEHSFSIPFKNPTLRWGNTRLMRCQLVSDQRDTPDRRPTSASPSRPPTSHQSKNDPSPSSGRPRLVIRNPCRTQRRDPQKDRPPVPEERQDHRQETREAAGGGAPPEIARPVPGPVTRSSRSRAGTQGEEKTGKKAKPAMFNISLSEEEIMEDFVAITGAKPSRRPKQRPRPLQKKLNEIFPGSDLPKIVTADLYRVS